MRVATAHRLIALIGVGCLIAASGVTSADPWDGAANNGPFEPTISVTTGTLADSSSNLTLFVSQRQHEDIVSTYDLLIPSGWRFAVGQVKNAPSSFTSCAGFDANNSTQINANMEALGPASMMLETTQTDDPKFTNGLGSPPPPGPATFLGYTYFLRWVPNSGDPSTGTATLCVLVGTTNVRIDAGTNNNNNHIMFQVALTLNADRSWDAVWNLKTPPGGVPGTHSVIDNPYYQQQEVTVRQVSFQLPGQTKGNYNVDPTTNQKGKVLFTFTPDTPGLYTFNGTFIPCGYDPAAGDPLLCHSNQPPAHAAREINVVNELSGLHPIPIMTSPKTSVFAQSSPFALPIRGTAAVNVAWNAVTVPPTEQVKGYLVTTGVPYRPWLIHFDYLVTNPADPGYDAERDPCAPDGAATSCSFALTFPLATTNGETLGVDGFYSTSLVAIFEDGHRSDGRCDDGTGAGTPPPCPDGSTPQFTSPGFTYAQYVLRARNWPLLYTYATTTTIGRQIRVSQLWVFFVDLDAHQAELVKTMPYGKSYPMNAAAIDGSNAAATGSITFLDNTNTQGDRMGFQGLLAPTGIYGILEFFSSNTSISSQILVTGNKQV